MSDSAALQARIDQYEASIANLTRAQKLDYVARTVYASGELLGEVVSGTEGPISEEAKTSVLIATAYLQSARDVLFALRQVIQFGSCGDELVDTVAEAIIAGASGAFEGPR